MKIIIPLVLAVNEASDRKDVIQQIKNPALILNGTMSRFTRGSLSGTLFQEDGSQNRILIVPPKARVGTIGSDIDSIISSAAEPKEELLDVSDGRWLRNSNLVIHGVSDNIADRTKSVLESWTGAFSYVEENVAENIPGLRKPQIPDASGLLRRLLEGGHTVIAGRLAGAFRNIGRDRIADDIVKTMAVADYAVRENDPFTDKPSLVIGARETSPYVNRLRLLWQKMREPVIERFPKAPGPPRNVEACLKRVNDAYVTDAYHSLSIEGYRVTPALIECVRSGTWNPEADEGNREQRSAMAARGYWQAFQSVQKSLGKILKGQNPGEVAETDHGTWYRELFAPSVTVGLLKPADLAGYRNGQVYIRKSMHVPLNRDAVRDAMPAFFDLLRDEPHPAVRVVLGHFIFVYIHPYMDGNGRVGRFLMNTMMASGGYPWTVIPVTDRNAYVNALEKASVGEDIAPFADFLARLVKKRLAGEPLPAVPKASLASLAGRPLF